MILTEDQQQDQYPALTYEGATSSNEMNTQNAMWDNYNSTSIDIGTIRVNRPGSFGSSGTNGNYVQLLRKSTGSVGATKMLKVMSGDKIHVKVDYFYTTTNADNSSASGWISALLAIRNAVNYSNNIAGFAKQYGIFFTALQLTVPDMYNFLAPEDSTVGGTNNVPKAYLHVLLFDERFRFDAANSYVEQVAYTPNTPGTIEKVMGNAVQVKKNGYAYVYISNESYDMVYFDNLLLTHERGPILEETHYYPFGLTMMGLSSKSLTFGDPENKKNKFQNQEFNSDLGVSYYEFKYRNHDPQIGRFIQIDPLGDKYVYNSLYAFSENKVTNHVELEGLESTPAGYLQEGLTQIGLGLARGLDNLSSLFTIRSHEFTSPSSGGSSVSVTYSTRTDYGTNFLAWVQHGKNPDATVSNGPSLFKSETKTEVKTEFKQEAETSAGTVTTKTAIDGSSHEVKTERTSIVEGVPVVYSLSTSQNATAGDNKVKAQVGVGTKTIQLFGSVEFVQNQSNNTTNFSVGIEQKTGNTKSTFSIGKSF